MAREMEPYLRAEVRSTPFCPGCGHGILMNHMLRAIKQSGLSMEQMLFVSGIGCAAWIPSPNFKADTLHTLHGRAIAFATGAKLYNPELNTVVISGDGDLTSIGGNHLIHAARRNIDLTVICANNMIFGMTGGQAASTSPLGTVSATTKQGNPYQPFDLKNLVLGAGAAYVARYSVTQPYLLIDAIATCLSQRGFSFVEVLSPCYTQYGRRNKIPSVEPMLAALMQCCISREEAASMNQDELKDKIITGEWRNGND